MFPDRGSQTLAMLRSDDALAVHTSPERIFSQASARKTRTSTCYHCSHLAVYPSRCQIMQAMKFDHPFVPLLGRLLMMCIFATSGLAKVFSWQTNIQYMSTRHLPLIPVLLAVAAVIELGGSICLITGYRAREAAFIMFLYMIPLTALFHNYWAASGMLAGAQETHFRKNLAIMGGLLMLTYAGPGRWSLGKFNKP